MRDGAVEVRRRAWEGSRATKEFVCLLLARNCEADLPEWLVGVSKFAGAVVALDDGSTDLTRKLLEEHPLVQVLLTNPPRESAREGRTPAKGPGRSESLARDRLLSAAVPLRARWLLFLDADERIPAADGQAMLEFLRSDALPGVGYGFAVSGAPGARGSATQFAYRLFAARAGQRLPSVSALGSQLPTDVPRADWVETSLRIQRATDLRVAESVDETDPKALETTAVVLDPARHDAIASRLAMRAALLTPLDFYRPVLSAVVISQNDRECIGPVMEALVAQKTRRPIEFILVNSGTDGTAEYVREHHPEVRVFHLPEPALPGKARNTGLAFARGDYVSFPGSHVVLPPGSLQRRIDAHELGYSMVTGTALNGTRTLSGWASYFLDHADGLPDRPSFALWAPPSHCSYLRARLVELGGFPEDRRTGEDTFVNRRLFYSGYRAWRSSEIRFVHRSPCRNPLRLCRHHFRRGEGYGRLLRERTAQMEGAQRRRLVARRMLLHPWKRMLFTLKNVMRWGGRSRLVFVAALPLVLLGTLASTLGALRGVRDGDAGVDGRG